MLALAAAGATRNALTKGMIEGFTLPPFSLAEQQSIAALLGALEDKIDLNRRTSDTLERMAQAIFKDWFVDFGPTRAKAEGRPPYLTADIWALFPADLNEGGEPEGWCSGRLADIAKPTGQIVKPDELSADTPYIGLEHMPRRSIALYDWEGAGKVTSAKLRLMPADERPIWPVGRTSIQFPCYSKKIP